MKRCGTCGVEKPHDEFNRKSSRPDGRQEVCRSCNRESSRRYYRRNREHHKAVIRARTTARMRDGIAFVGASSRLIPAPIAESPTSGVLDFDHRPGSGKRADVMRLVRDGHPLTTIAAEIEKCDIRCRNCHAIVTYDRMGGSWRSRAQDELPRAGD